MKLILFFILVVPTIAMANFPELNDCKINKDWIKKKIEKVKDISSKRDISDAVKHLKKVAAYSCPKEISEQIDKSSKPYVKLGLVNHISFMKEEASRVSYFREPTEELSEIKRARQKLTDMGVKNIPSDLSTSVKKAYNTRGTSKSSARKSSCSNVDNRKPPLATLNSDGSVKKNNMRNQDSIGWCYAYTAADMIGHKTGKNVSAIDIANAYNEGSISDWFSNNESTMEGGYIEDAANVAIDRGLCYESQLPSDDYTFSTKSEDLMDELKAIEKLYDVYNKKVTYVAEGYFYNSRVKKTGESFTNAHNGFKNDIQCGKIASDWDQLFNNLNIYGFMDAIKHATSANDFIDRLIKKNCTPRYKAGNLSFDSMSAGVWYGKDDVMSKIDSRLKKGEVLGISYKSTILKDKYDHSDGNHASLVVARKFNSSTGSCEYLIRNSWGTGCSSYDDDYKCTQGNIWVPEEYFRQATYGVTYAD